MNETANAKRTEGMKLLRHNRNYNLKTKGSRCIARIET